MPHDIIDNQEQKLADHVGRMLENAEKAKFAVGYFFLSGFKAIAERLQNIKELRLLIGSSTSLETLEELAKGHNGLGNAKSLIERRKYLTAEEKKLIVAEDEKTLADSTADIDQSDENEAYLKTLAGMIESGKIKVKVYTKGTLHAKAYIVDYPEGRYERGSAIVGSSNLSLAGIESNTELNVVVPGNENHQKLSAWFDDLWNESVDFNENLIHVLKNSWAMNEPTPYELYLKVVYELVKDRLTEEKETPKPKRKGVPTLYGYQIDAVKQARNILMQYNGVFLADVVGLGKTYMGAGLLADLYEREGWRALIVCPPMLIKAWREITDDYDLNAKIVSIGKLSEVLEDERLMSREIVLVDESHRFRHENTQRYKDLADICFGKKVILLTATPQNTDIWDIYHQIKLFHPREWTNIPIDPPNLKEFFKEAENGKRAVPELLEHLLIRRTRKHISRYYEEDMKKNDLRFPKRMPPKRIDYSIDDVYPGIYDEIANNLLRLKYARYDLWHYAKPQHRTESGISQLQTAGKNLVKLMRATFFKRLESSVAAFRATTDLLISSHEAFLRLLDEGVVPAGPSGEDIIDAMRFGDEELEGELLEKLGDQLPASKFEIDKLRADLQSDLKIFEKAAEFVRPISAKQDAKLQTLIAELSKPEWQEQKALIYSQFSATVEYIGKELQHHFDNVEYVSGSTNNLLEIVRRFAPEANRARMAKAKEIRILVATDILSEGLNLQDANRVINYDIHWNPVRLIQRIGRIDRVSSKHDTIWTYNFFPERKLEEKLGLESRVRNRIDEIHKNIGEDAKYLSPDEQLCENSFFKIYMGEASVLEEELTEESNFADLVQMLQQIRSRNPELFSKIESLPPKIRSAKKAVDGKGLVVFCKAGEFYRLYRADDKGTVISQDQNSILKELSCEPSEPRFRLPIGFNAKVDSICKMFEAEANQRENEKSTGESDPIVRSILNVLKNTAKGSSDETKARVSKLRRQLLQTSLTKSQRTEYRRISRKVSDKEEILEELERILSTHQTSLFGLSKPKIFVALKAQIIASEAFVQ